MVLLNDTQMEQLKGVGAILQRIYSQRHVTMTEYQQLFSGVGGRVYAEVYNQHNQHPYQERRGNCSSCGRNIVADAMRLAIWYINTKNNK